MVDVVVGYMIDTLLPMMSVTRRMMVPIPEAESDRNDREEKAKRDETVVENIMKAAQIHLVVAALLMTVTFTAGFTLPGAVFAYFLMATKSISSATTEIIAIIRLYNMAILLQLMVMTAVVVSFSTGLYVTLAHSVGLAVLSVL
ncbi:hypothetical protein P3L10_016635 [Capsicum annuum]